MGHGEFVGIATCRVISHECGDWIDGAVGSRYDSSSSFIILPKPVNSAQEHTSVTTQNENVFSVLACVCTEYKPLFYDQSGF